MYHDVQKFLPLLLPTTTVHMNMWNNAASCHWSFHTPAIVISPAPTAVIPLLYWELLPKFRKFIKDYWKYQQFLKMIGYFGALSSSIIILMISALYVLCVPSSHPQNAVINFLLKFVYIEFCHWGSAYDPPYCTASANEDYTPFIPLACVMIKLYEQ